MSKGRKRSADARVSKTDLRPVTQEKRDEIIALRAQGLTPKAIARRLGLRPAEVSPIIREHTSLTSPGQAREEGPLQACLVSPGWSIGLGLDGEARQWPDVACSAESSAQGLVTVVVVRRNRYGKLAYCLYLVDAFCLGVKNVHGPRGVSEDELRDRARAYFAQYPAPPIAAPLELAQCLVLGGVAYAAALGFSPHPDFAAARSFLGEWSGSCPITFGRHGKPLYVAGPNDDPLDVISTLQRTVGEGNFEYVMPVF